MWTWLGTIAAVVVGCLLYDKVWEPVSLWVQDLLEERRAVTEHAEATLDELPAWAESMGIELTGENTWLDPEVRDEAFTFDRKWLNEQRPWEPPTLSIEDLERKRR